jgi:hypothetical protein
VQAPIVAILIIIIMRLYSDLMDYRKIAESQRSEMLDRLDDLKERVVKLEIEITGNRSPTSVRRPSV